MTTEKLRHRSRRSCFSRSRTRFAPRKSTSPETISAGSISSREIANSRVDFPHADSPTRPRNSPGYTLRLTPSTARVLTEPPYSTARFRTSSSGLGSSTLPLLCAQGRITDLVDGVVDERHAGAQEGNAETRCDDPERGAGQQRFRILGPVKHGAPAQVVGIAQADELQTGRCEHSIQRRAQEYGDDEADHVGEYFPEDDVSGVLPADARRFQEVTVTEREGLRSDLTSAIRPPRNGNHGDQDPHPSALGVLGDDDHQREYRDHQEDVGDRGEHPVDRTAEIGGRRCRRERVHGRVWIVRRDERGQEGHGDEPAKNHDTQQDLEVASCHRGNARDGAKNRPAWGGSQNLRRWLVEGDMLIHDSSLVCAARSRVKNGVGYVREEDGAEYRDRNHQEQRLHQRIIVVLY